MAKNKTDHQKKVDKVIAQKKAEKTVAMRPNRRAEQNKDMQVSLSRYTVGMLKRNDRGYGTIDNGTDNLFPDYLNSLVAKSVTMQNIVDDLANYILGLGLRTEDPTEQPIVDRLFPNRKTKNLLADKIVQAELTIELIRGEVNKSVVKVNRHNPATIRIRYVEEGIPCEFQYRMSWDKGDRNSYNKTEFFEAWDPKNKLQNVGLFYWYEANNFPVYYGRPKYISGLDAIELETSAYKGVNHGVQNGWEPSKIVELSDMGSDEANQQAIEDITRDLSGVANRGKLAVRMKPQGADPMTVIESGSSELNQNHDSIFALAELGILKAFQIPSPSLISGLNTKASGFSSPAEEMEWAKNELFYKIIEPEREEFLELMGPIFKECGIQSKVYFQEREQGKTTAIIDGQPAEEAVVVEEPAVNETMRDLTGRQMQNIERILRKHEQGKLKTEAAVNLLMRGYGMSEEEAKMWLDIAPEEEETELSENVALSAFIGTGEDPDIEGYEMIMADRMEGEEADIEPFLNSFGDVLLARAISGGGTNNESEQDTPLFKVRYFYQEAAQKRSGYTGKHREFCKKMRSAAKVYRKEDIEAAGSEEVNKGFGLNGAPTYSIWLYKGGPQCYHFWERRIYLQKDNSKITVNEARRMILDLPVDERELNRLEQNPREVAQTPMYTRNRGWVNPPAWVVGLSEQALDIEGMKLKLEAIKAEQNE